MKKIFVGLLITAAAGAGVYYLLQTKKTSSVNEIQKELLIGKWKLDTVTISPHDSSRNLISHVLKAASTGFAHYLYDFQKDGKVVRFIKDSLAKDTSHYEWTKANNLAWKDHPADTAVETLGVIRLDNDGLVLQTIDSASLYFSKMK